MVKKAPLRGKIVAMGLLSMLLGCGRETADRPLQMVIPERYVRDSDEMLARDSLGNQLFRDSLFSGYLTRYHDNGNLSALIPFYHGLEEGAAIWFFSNGDTAMIRPYRSGKKHGEHLAWYENGQLKFRYYFDAGLNVGNHQSWFRDGQLATDQHFKNGHEFGSQKMYRPDGKLRSNYVVRENGRKYGLVGLKRCAKLDGETGDFDPYKGIE